MTSPGMEQPQSLGHQPRKGCFHVPSTPSSGRTNPLLPVGTGRLATQQGPAVTFGSGEDSPPKYQVCKLICVLPHCSCAQFWKNNELAKIPQ